jgi:NAD(P)-binding Rossmann-like domain
MVLPCRKSSDHSTLADCSLATSMSRMQQDLAGTNKKGNTKSASKPDMLRQALKNGRKPHVCIIGAGFAGLRCADILLQQGVKVTIFEARNRIGGRVSFSSTKSAPSPDHGIALSSKSWRSSSRFVRLSLNLSESYLTVRGQRTKLDTWHRT